MIFQGIVCHYPACHYTVISSSYTIFLTSHIWVKSQERRQHPNHVFVFVSLRRGRVNSQEAFILMGNFEQTTTILAADASVIFINRVSKWKTSKTKEKRKTITKQSNPGVSFFFKEACFAAGKKKKKTSEKWQGRFQNSIGIIHRISSWTSCFRACFWMTQVCYCVILIPHFRMLEKKLRKEIWHDFPDIKTGKSFYISFLTLITTKCQFPALDLLIILKYEQL